MSLLLSRENASPFSLFFAQDVPDAANLSRYDAIVIPALRFLALPARPHLVPIIASGPVSMIAECFDAGCADYLIEPWIEDELYARAAARAAPCLELEHGDIRATQGGVIGPRGSAPLSHASYRLLVVLYLNRGAAVPRQALACCVADGRKGVRTEGRALDMRIARLRASLRAAGATETAKNIRGQHRSYALLA